MFIFRDRVEGRSGRPRVQFSGPSGRGGRSWVQFPPLFGRQVLEVAGSIFGNAWKVRAEGREINCRYLERGRSGRSRVQLPGPSRREEQEFAGLISGTEWVRGVGACRFDSRHQTNTQRLKNTEGEGTYFALLTFP